MTTLSDPLTHIIRIDKLLDLNREMLVEAQTAKDPDKIVQLKERIDVLLDERLLHMKVRDAVPKKRARRGPAKEAA